MDKEITKTTTPISPMFLGYQLMKSKHNEERELWFLLPPKEGSWGPHKLALLTIRKWEWWWKNSKHIHSMERWMAQWNGANVLLSRSESLKQSKQHNITWNFLRKWCFFMAFYSMALGDYVNPLRCEKGLFRAQLGLWPAYHADSAQIWCQIGLGADPLVVGRPTNFNKCTV